MKSIHPEVSPVNSRVGTVTPGPLIAFLNRREAEDAAAPAIPRPAPRPTRFPCGPLGRHIRRAERPSTATPAGPRRETPTLFTLPPATYGEAAHAS